MSTGTSQCHKCGQVYDDYNACKCVSHQVSEQTMTINCNDYYKLEADYNDLLAMHTRQAWTIVGLHEREAKLVEAIECVLKRYNDAIAKNPQASLLMLGSTIGTHSILEKALAAHRENL